MKVVVIIPAAGLGTRMASPPSGKGKKAGPSKQFTELGGTPVLIHTLGKFAASEEVSEIYVALRETEIASFRKRLEKEAPDILQKEVTFVEGGTSPAVGRQCIGCSVNVACRHHFGA